MTDNLLQGVIFWAFALFAVGGALGAAFHKSIVYAALFILLVFLSMAGFFVLNNADFLAIAQLLIYAVGLTIIMLFAIMFTGDKPLLDQRANKASIVAYSIVTAFVFALLLKSASFPFNTSMAGTTAELVASQGSTAKLGVTLFKTYGLPFELASVLLLIAMVGAIVLAKKRFDGDEHTTAKYALDERSQMTAEAKSALERQKAIAGDPGEQQGSNTETVGANS